MNFEAELVELATAKADLEQYTARLERDNRKLKEDSRALIEDLNRQLEAQSMELARYVRELDMVKQTSRPGGFDSQRSEGTSNFNSNYN